MSNSLCLISMLVPVTEPSNSVKLVPTFGYYKYIEIYPEDPMVIEEVNI